jgi:septal ring factor EnvC (AmiA/AmiB activator)
MLGVILFAAQISGDPLVNQIWIVLIGQAVVGALVLIGFVAVGRRFISQEFPAVIKDIRDDIHEMREELSKTNRELLEMRIQINRHQDGIESLKEWRREIKGDLDDTRSGNPRPRTRR